MYKEMCQLVAGQSDAQTTTLPSEDEQVITDPDWTVYKMNYMRPSSDDVDREDVSDDDEEIIA